MPYFNMSETRVDRYGNVITLGDILKLDRNDIELSKSDFFVCCIESEAELSIRDLSNNNVGMCDLGINGNVINLGNINSERVQAEFRKYKIEFDFDDYLFYFDPFCDKEKEQEIFEAGRQITVYHRSQIDKTYQDYQDYKIKNLFKSK